MATFPDLGVECPFCKVTIHPYVLYNNDAIKGCNYACCCTKCGKMFIAEVLFDKQLRKYYCKCIYPKIVPHKKFSPQVSELSEKFVDIYNQAFAAETYGLNEIAGMGYRKALEFLIKDYLIHVEPDQSDAIKRAPLSQCISTRVQNENIKAVASRSAWLGNDFTHYVPKFEDKDISDMKNFIDAVAYWISMELITESALNIKPVK